MVAYTFKLSHNHFLIFRHTDYLAIYSSDSTEFELLTVYLDNK
jgi:hypothetical protein